MATESRSHAPGHEIGEGSIGQHKMMASGSGVMPGGNFGCGPTPGTAKIGGGMPNGRMLSDNERAGGPGIKMGGDSMTATRHSDHGPHGHSMAMHSARR